MFGDDDTVTSKAGALKREVEERTDEMLELRVQLRQRTLLLNKLAVCIPTGSGHQPLESVARPPCLLTCVQRERELEREAHAAAMEHVAGVAEEVHGAARDAMALLDMLRRDLTCPMCGKPMASPQHLQPCGHMMCAKCVPVRCCSAVRMCLTMCSDRRARTT